MLKAAQETAGSIELLGVTVLTSQSDLQNIGVKNSVRDQVKLLVNLAIKVVSLVLLRQRYFFSKIAIKKTKDILPRNKKWGNKQDQRVMSYADFSKIADDKCFAVIGRPIIGYDPVQTSKRLHSLLT